MALRNIGIRFGHVGEDEFLRLRQQTASQRSALFRDHFHDISGDRRSDDRPLTYALELMQEEQAECDRPVPQGCSRDDQR